MPGGNGQGPWWGRGNWFCRRGAGFGFGRGMGRGFGFGRGMGRGFGFGGGFGYYNQNYQAQIPVDQNYQQPVQEYTKENEIAELKRYSEELKAELDEIKKRIKEITKK